MKWLVIGRGTDGVEGAQLEGFDLFRADLRRELGLELWRQDASTLEEARRAIEGHPWVDTVVYMPSWGEAAEDLIAWCREQRAGAGPRLVLLDSYAQTSSPHLGAAPFVDLYVKRQVLRDRAQYLRDRPTGYVFSEFLARGLDWDVGTWRFGSVLPAEHAHKLIVGWSLGVKGRYWTLARAARFTPWALRTLDVNARLGLAADQDGRDEWYHRYRRLVRERLDALSGRLAVSHSGRVSRRRYLIELMRSRVVVSPFGWGEVCFRDYEAVALGCVLVKPSMAHLETRPDIYVDHETYLPLRWDLQDLEEVVRRCLEEPRRAQRIAENGRRRLLDYFERGGFVADIRRVIDALAGRRPQVVAG